MLVIGDPVVTSIGSSDVALVGGPVTIVAVVESNSALETIIWQFQGVAEIENGSLYRLENTGSPPTFSISLTVLNASRNDSGSYQLVVTNFVNGTDTVVFNLTVEGN